MQVEVLKEHEWLQRLVGEWTSEMEAVMGPGEPPMKHGGTECVRSLGGIWMVCEGRMEMPEGGVGSTILSLGYDPLRQRFVGTFLASMMTHLWVYEGTLDPSGQVLTLNTEGPTFTAPGQMGKFKDVITFHGDDHRTLTSHALGEDGQWQQFMTANYRRTK